jgi:Ala-tRNA(Pro) deacylase
MAINPRLKALLDRHGASYEVLPHRAAFTAQDVARTTHVTGRRVAKVVVIRDEAGADLMVVIPATHHLDQGQLRTVTGRRGVHLEDEAELGRLFPDCETGTMPPFGVLYRMPLYVDPCLAFERNIYFQAGSHVEVVRMSYEEYVRIAVPIVMDVCLHREMAVLTS